MSRKKAATVNETREQKDTKTGAFYRGIAGSEAEPKGARNKLTTEFSPSLGSGRVFPISEEAILCDPMPIPKHWYQIIGIDFGWEHPFAATQSAWDKDNDIWYVVASYREAKATPPIHYAAIRPWSDWLPCAWPHDGLQHGKGSGNELASHYKKLGLKMLDEHATHAAGGMGIEAGITKMLERMQTCCFKVLKRVPLLPPRGGISRKAARRPDLFDTLRHHDGSLR